MFRIDNDMTIHITRGDIGVIEVSMEKNENELHTFVPGDVVRFQVYPKKHHEDIVLSKEVRILEETQFVEFVLETTDTKLGEIINKPATYWYEVELNPDTSPQTFIGYDDQGPKLFMLYPEGGDDE